MPFIATNTSTVGEVVQSCADILLNGMYAHSAVRTNKIDLATNVAARHAIEEFARLLNEVYCADRDTLLKDVPTPTDPGAV